MVESPGSLAKMLEGSPQPLIELSKLTPCQPSSAGTSARNLSSSFEVAWATGRSEATRSADATVKSVSLTTLVRMLALLTDVIPSNGLSFMQ